MTALNDLIRKNEKMWDLFTLKEEYNATALDAHGRFKHSSSSNSNVLVPHVSRHFIDNGYEIEYPEGRKFALCLTP